MDTAAHSSSVSGKPSTEFLLDDQENLRRGVGPPLNSALKPRAAVLDARLPDGSGIDVCREIRSAMPEVRCLTLTGCDDNDRSSC